jgi:hypothetical protein
MKNLEWLRSEVENILNDLKTIQSRVEFVQHLLESTPDNACDIISHYQIQDPHLGRIPFKLYSYQREIIDTLENNQRIIVKAARQMGLTTISALYSLYLASTHDNFRILILVNKQDRCREIISRILFSIQSLNIGIVTAEQNSLELSNGSSITCVSAPYITGDAVINCLIVDEMECISHKTMDDAWNMVLPPLLRPTSKIIVMSTPRLDQGLFYRLWNGAPENGFVTRAYGWREHPERDEEWAEKTMQEMGMERFLAEWDCA